MSSISMPRSGAGAATAAGAGAAADAAAGVVVTPPTSKKEQSSTAAKNAQVASNNPDAEPRPVLAKCTYHWVCKNSCQHSP
eukprot:3117335-Amphidinium_carterae.1